MTLTAKRGLFETTGICFTRFRDKILAFRDRLR
jgi:hypothetical protein